MTVEIGTAMVCHAVDWQKVAGLALLAIGLTLVAYAVARSLVRRHHRRHQVTVNVADRLKGWDT